MSRTDETRFIEWHKMCKCECKLGENICNNKQRWNKNKCGCECKELIDKGVCDIQDLFVIVVTVNVNVIKHVILVNI